MIFNKEANLLLNRSLDRHHIGPVMMVFERPATELWLLLCTRSDMTAPSMCARICRCQGDLRILAYLYSDWWRNSRGKFRPYRSIRFSEHLARERARIDSPGVFPPFLRPGGYLVRGDVFAQLGTRRKEVISNPKGIQRTTFLLVASRAF